MVRVFPISANQPNEIALTICNPISRYCFRLMRDWKLENLPHGKEISVVPFRMEKEEYLWRYSTISERNFRKITLPFDFKPKFPDFLAKWWAPQGWIRDRSMLPSASPSGGTRAHVGTLRIVHFSPPVGDFFFLQSPQYLAKPSTYM